MAQSYEITRQNDVERRSGGHGPRLVTVRDLHSLERRGVSFAEWITWFNSSELLNDDNEDDNSAPEF
jgi:hypothetical protein